MMAANPSRRKPLTIGELEDARRAAERLLGHWSTHQEHADWVYEQSREWLRLYGLNGASRV